MGTPLSAPLAAALSAPRLHKAPRQGPLSKTFIASACHSVPGARTSESAARRKHRRPVPSEAVPQTPRPVSSRGQKSSFPQPPAPAFRFFTLQPRRCTSARRAVSAFTLLEVIIVLAITALALAAVYAIAQGALTLADDVSRAGRRDTRAHAFTTFCEHLLRELPPTALLNITTAQDAAQYLTRLDLQNVRSPFSATPGCHVTLHTQAQPGGGLRLLLTCQPPAGAGEPVTVPLFDDLLQCDWAVFDSATHQWLPAWSETSSSAAPAFHSHPSLLKLTLTPAAAPPQEHVFWIAPATETTAMR